MKKLTPQTYLRSLWPFNLASRLLVFSLLVGVFVSIFASNGNALTVHFAPATNSTNATDVTVLDMPKDLLPKWGECRAWRPGIERKRASKPGSCSNLAQRILPGAWLVHGPRESDTSIQVWIFANDHTGVAEKRWFDKETMELVRVEKVERKYAESPPEE